MFVQVITGHTSDAEGLRRQTERWRTEVRPGAIGVLGGTSGVADDGTFVTIARFADEASARKNADRPEQSAWWAETAKYFDGEPTFRESSDVDTIFGGGSDDATFVQVMEGRTSDKARAKALETDDLLASLRAARPDLLGAVRAWFPDDTYVQVAYFTSEGEARTGESDPTFTQQQEEYLQLFGEMTFTDLRAPLFS
jgi:hypothetical protein